MSDFERRPISLKIALFVDDQIGRLSAWGHRIESGWQTLNRGWDLESIGAFCSRRDFQFGHAVGWILQPGWLTIQVLAWIIATCWNGLLRFPLLKTCLTLLSLWGWRMIGQPFREVLCFGIELFRSRNPALWQWLATAFIIFIPVGGVGLLFGNFSRHPETVKAYQIAIQTDVEQGNLDRVRLFQFKLAQLGNDQGQMVMRAVHDLAAQGKTQAAALLAEGLAPNDQPGLAAAHLYLALFHLRNDASQNQEQACQRAEQHLQQLEAIHRNVAGEQALLPLELQYLRASLKIRQDRIAEALAILRQLSPDFWPATLTSLELNWRSGFQPESQMEGRRLVEWAGRKPELLEQLSSESFAIWFRSLIPSAPLFPGVDTSFPESDQHAYRVAEQWLDHFPWEPDAATAFLISTQSRLLTLRPGNREQHAQALWLLNHLFTQLETRHRQLLESWAMPRLIAAAPETSNIYTVALAAATQREASASLLEMLSSAEIARKKYQQAYELLQRVVNRDPSRATAWNNLAVLIKRYRWEPLESAYQYSSRAIQLEPQQTAMRMTRAMIAMELQHWEIARLDLEQVLRAEPDHPELHELLARVYQGLGESDKQQLHELLAGR